MLKHIGTRIEYGVLVIAIALFATASCFAQGTQTPAQTRDLSGIGNVGPKAIPLKVWTDTPEGASVKPGDSIVVHLQAGEKAYLTAVYLSGSGNTIILIPNAEASESLLLPNTEYTLFGDDSRLKLTVDKKMKEGKIVFYVSPVPFSLNEFKPEPGKACVIIAPDAKDRLDLLQSKLEAMAKDQGFNRVALSLKANGKKGMSLNLMGIPGAIKSETPETMTGVQGMRPAVTSETPETVTGVQGIRPREVPK